MSVRPSSLKSLLFVLVALPAIVALACGGDDDDQKPDRVRLNELQYIGTHNSFHIQPPQAALDAIAAFRPDFAASIEFTVPPLRQQLDAGMRLIELDAWYDPEGGRYARRIGAEMLGIPALEGLDQLRAPGFKVMHSPEADFYSTCWTLKSCLSEIAAWSDANPGHLPIAIWVEAKDEPTPDPLNWGFVKPLPIDAGALSSLQAEILSVFDSARLITPDLVRGKRSTLEEAVLTDGWPAVEDLLGKVMFVLLDDPAKRELYVAGSPSLEGKVMFTSSGTAGQADAAVMRIDDIRKQETVRQLIQAGYLVRTMADAESIEPRKNDTSRRDAAFASGAHQIVTDFPESIGVAAAAGGYVVRFPDGGYVRCNPVTASAACAAVIGPLARR